MNAEKMRSSKMLKSSERPSDKRSDRENRRPNKRVSDFYMKMET